MSELIRVRECDGSCCKQSPQFPNDAGDGCIYRNKSGCKLMAGEASVPVESMGQFIRACLDWPHNMPDRETGDCCWQWVNNGN